MIRYARRIGALISGSSGRLNSGSGLSRLRRALVIILCLAVAFLYWTSHEYESAYQADYFGEPETVYVFGVAIPALSLFGVAEDLAIVFFVLTYLAVMIAFMLPRTVSALLRALPLSFVGVVILVSILHALLVGRESPRWLACILIWSLPLAAGFTLLQELLPYFCSPMPRRNLL